MARGSPPEWPTSPPTGSTSLPTGSRQSHAAHVAKKCRRRSADGRSPASLAVRAASTDQARPGRPPNGAESRPRAFAHALTCLANPANAGPWPLTEASTASASLTALSATAAASPNSARRSTASMGSSGPVATTARSTSSPSSRSRRPGTRAPTTSRTSQASCVTSLNFARTVASSTGPGSAATRSRSAPGSAQPMRREPTTCTTPSGNASATRRVTRLGHAYPAVLVIPADLVQRRLFPPAHLSRPQTHRPPHPHRLVPASRQQRQLADPGGHGGEPGRAGGGQGVRVGGAAQAQVGVKPS